MEQHASLILVETPNTLVPQLQIARQGLIDGLLSRQLPDGWPDTYLSERSSSVWTSAIVLRSLLRSGVMPECYSAVIARMLESKRELRGYVGWELERRFPGHISTLVTADVVSVLAELHRFDIIPAPLATLQDSQNEDGGWGDCPGDRVSKTRSTVWVLDTLLYATRLPASTSLVRRAVIEKAIKWLRDAQLDLPEDAGWGYSADSPPGSVSSTAEAIRVLLKAGQMKLNIAGTDEGLRRALRTLKLLGNQGYWKGEIEDLVVVVDDETAGRHSAGGSGTTAVIRALIEAVDLKLLSPDNNELLQAISNLLTRCQPYPGEHGLWINPSDQGGPPVFWNSAYALDALGDFESYYLRTIQGTYVERQVYDAIRARTRGWKFLAIALMVAMGGIGLVASLPTLGPLASTFSRLAPLSQGLILIVVTICIEEIYHRLLEPTFQGLMRRRRERLTSRKA